MRRRRSAFTDVIPWLWLRWVLAIIAAIVTGYSFWTVIMAWKDGYNADRLYQELRHMAGTEKHSSIVAINDGNRYLLYHDKQWGCDFFPNHSTSDSEAENLRLLTEYLSKGFDIPSSDFTLTRITGKRSEKYSTEHDETRVYDYTLYRATVKHMPDAWKAGRFHVDSKDCRWMTTDEMLADPVIRRINSDVIALVRDNL